MTRQLISSGSQFEHDIGYSRAVVDGEWVFVSGTTGFDYATMTISDSLLDQTEQCLKNIQSALQQAGRSSLTWCESFTCCLMALDSPSAGPYCASTWAPCVRQR